MPRKDWSSPRLVVNGHYWKALHFARSAFKPPLETIWPKLSSSGRLNAYFFLLWHASQRFVITTEPSESVVCMQQQTVRKWEYHPSTQCKIHPDWIEVSYTRAFGMFQVHYTIWMKEHNAQRVQSMSEIQFYTHDPWLSKLDSSLGLSQSY